MMLCTFYFDPSSVLGIDINSISDTSLPRLAHDIISSVSQDLALPFHRTHVPSS